MLTVSCEAPAPYDLRFSLSMQLLKGRGGVLRVQLLLRVLQSSDSLVAIPRLRGCAVTVLPFMVARRKAEMVN